MRISITSLDRRFSLWVRRRASWRCERCHKHYPPPTTALHCSHFHGRRNKGTRWDPDNCSALCFACHQYFGENPLEHAAWMRKRLGGRRFNLLTIRANTPTKPDLRMAKLWLDQSEKKSLENFYW